MKGGIPLTVYTYISFRYNWPNKILYHSFLKKIFFLLFFTDPEYDPTGAPILRVFFFSWSKVEFLPPKAREFAFRTSENQYLETRNQSDARSKNALTWPFSGADFQVFP